MKALFVLLVYLTSTSLSAQNWFENNPVWINKLVIGFLFHGPEYITVKGDTILDGKPAIILARNYPTNMGTNFDHIRIVRQTGDTIWVWGQGSAFHIMYNFSLGIGDSVSIPMYNNVFDKYYIDSVGQIDIGNQNIRFQRIQLHTGLDYFKCHSWIFEKIGIVNGKCFNSHTGYTIFAKKHFFLDESNSGYVDGPERNFCSYKNDQFDYSQPSNFCIGLVNIEEPISKMRGLSLFPNPFTHEVSLRLLENEKIELLRIFDLMGRLVKTCEVPDAGLINVDGITPGIYLFEVISNEHKRYFKMAIKA